MVMMNEQIEPIKMHVMSIVQVNQNIAYAAALNQIFG